MTTMAATTEAVSLRWHGLRGWGWDETVAHVRTALHDDDGTALVMEGLRAHRRADGSVALFRPSANAAQFRTACLRNGLPPVPERVFEEAARVLARRQLRSTPDESPQSVHLRARIWCDGDDGCHFLLSSTPEEPLYDLRPGTVKLDQDGLATDPAVHPFFVFGPAAEARIATPPLREGPVIVRDTVLELAQAIGLPAREERVSVDVWRDRADNGQIREAFLCGTVDLIRPVSVIESPIGKWRVGNGQPGYATINLRRAMNRLVEGQFRDEQRWMEVVR